MFLKETLISKLIMTLERQLVNQLQGHMQHKTIKYYGIDDSTFYKGVNIIIHMY